ncbi:MAG TPA: thiol reductase thioredoxin [Polyangiaceae bacterium]|nr:thiol reductase thioredoxin [Polyangiaceae bacterium]
MGFFGKLLGLTPEKDPVHVDDSNFQEEIVRCKTPVVLDVWGPNCQPCKQLEPVIRSLAASYDGRVKVCEMNTHAGPRSAANMRIKGTPTVVYFKNGREVERVVGMHSSLYHEQTIEELFGIGKEAD